MDLTGQTVLITGAAKRLGATMARAAAAAGARVVVHANTSISEAQELAAGLPDALAVQWDLDAQPEGFIAQVQEELGAPIDHLIHNASTYEPSTWEDGTWGDLERATRIHAWAPWVLSRDFAQQIARPASTRPSIIMMLDTRLADVDAAHFAYHLSKATMAQLHANLAQLLAPIRVNAIAPGPVLPPVHATPAKGKSYLQKMGKLMPLGETPNPEDIGQAACFLMATRSITGQTVAIDSGRHMGRPIGDP